MPITTLGSPATTGSFSPTERRGEPENPLADPALDHRGGIFSAAAVLLIPVLGASGAPPAAIVAWGIATVAMMAIGQREHPLPLEYRKLATIGLLTLRV